MTATESRQEHYDRLYSERVERDRPKPVRELSELLRLAREASADPGKLIEWQLAATPQEVLAAVAADQWDRLNPWFSCIVCKDGDLLPQGYTCTVCGA